MASLRVVVLHTDNVGPAADYSTEKRGHKRDPEVVVTQREDLRTPASQAREQSRAEITRRVDGVASIVAQRHADRHDQERKRDGRPVRPGRSVAVVRDSEYAQHEHGRGQELRVERRGVRDEIARVGREVGARGRAVRIHAVEAVEIQRVDAGRTKEAGYRLRDHVARHLPGRHTAVDHIGQRHSRIQVRTTDALGAVHAEHDSDAPANVHAQPSTVGAVREPDLVVHAHTEDDHDVRAQELSHALAQVHTLHHQFAVRLRAQQLIARKVLVVRAVGVRLGRLGCTHIAGLDFEIDAVVFIQALEVVVGIHSNAVGGWLV